MNRAPASGSSDGPAGEAMRGAAPVGIAPGGPRGGGGRLRRTLALAAAAVLLLWSFRVALLTAAARWLVVQDPLTPVAVMVVSNASARAGALEAAWLYRRGVARTVVLPGSFRDELDEELRGLGIPFTNATDLARAVLERAGVPAASVELLPERVDGTRQEVAALGRFVREHGPGSLLFITARTHTARARWLLRHTLPAGVRIAVRSPERDAFDPASWWRSREQTREVILEYLRWIASLLLPGGGEETAGRAAFRPSRPPVLAGLVSPRAAGLWEAIGPAVRRDSL